MAVPLKVCLQFKSFLLLLLYLYLLAVILVEVLLALQPGVLGPKAI
jgi:hypothetical protein